MSSFYRKHATLNLAHVHGPLFITKISVIEQDLSDHMLWINRGLNQFDELSKTLNTCRIEVGELAIYANAKHRTPNNVLFFPSALNNPSLPADFNQIRLSTTSASFYELE
jgi:hypothetical protein